jgi:hypothetical protein
VAADKLVNLQGKRATSDDLSDLNKSLEFYEDAVNAYSSSVKDMWDRNIKLALEPESGEGAEDDVSLLFGAAGMASAVDEETETLFIEDQEADEALMDEEYLDPQEDFIPPAGDAENSLDTMADPSTSVPSLFSSPPVPVPAGPRPPEEAPPEEPAAGIPPAAPPPAAEEPLSAEPAPPWPPEPAPPPPARPPEFAPPPPPAPAASKPAPPEPAALELAASDPAEPEPADFEPPPPKPASPVEPPSAWPPQPGPPPPHYPPPPPAHYPPPPGPIEEEAPFPGTGPADRPEDVPFDDEDTEVVLIEGEEPDLTEEESAPEEPEAPVEEEAPLSEEEPEPLMEEEAPVPEEDASPSTPHAPPPLPEEKTSPPSSPVLGLMNYLKTLAEALPDGLRREYMQSQARLSMERIIDTLEGRRGPGETDGAAAGDLPPLAGSPRRGGKMAALRAAAYAKDAADRAAGRQKKPKKPDLTGMLAFIAKLAAAAPNANLGKTISHKVGTVLSGLKKPNKDGENRG